MGASKARAHGACVLNDGSCSPSAVLACLWQFLLRCATDATIDAARIRHRHRVCGRGGGGVGTGTPVNSAHATWHTCSSPVAASSYSVGPCVSDITVISSLCKCGLLQYSTLPLAHLHTQRTAVGQGRVTANSAVVVGARHMDRSPAVSPSLSHTS